MTATRSALVAGALLLASVALAGCATPTPPAAEPTPAETVLPDMTPAECAIAGSPWALDIDQFDRDYSVAMMAGNPEAASSGFVGDLTVTFGADGGFALATNGYHIQTTSKSVDESGTFGYIIAEARGGTSTAEWSDVDEARASIAFLDWAPGFAEFPPQYDDGSVYGGPMPAWQLTGRSGARLECDADGTGLWVRSTTPGYLDLHFVR